MTWSEKEFAVPHRKKKTAQSKLMIGTVIYGENRGAQG